MELEVTNFYEILSLRCTVLISTADKDGKSNTAPFSFVTPVSSNPPLALLFYTFALADSTNLFSMIFHS